VCGQSADPENQMSRKTRLTLDPRVHQAAGFAATALCLGSLLGCGVSQPGSSVSTGGPVASTAGPQLGYIWSPAERSLRPILGIPGASQIGQSVVPVGQYIAADTASSVALLQDTSGYALMALPSGTPLRLDLAALPASSTASQLRLSPNGTSAVIFHAGSSTATLITSVSPAGAAGANQTSSLSAPGPIVDAAVSDLGSVAALIPRASAGTQITLLGRNGSSSALATLAGSAGSLSFLGASTTNPDDLLIADASANTLTLVHAVSTAPSASTVATGTLLKAPAAVSAALNGHWAVVANGGEQSVVSIDLTAQNAPQRVACACQPTLAVPLADNGYFRITGPGAVASTDPTWIAAASPTPRTLFIPALAGSSTATAATSSSPNRAAALHANTSLKLGVR
jgi:hypothetical protein